MTKKQISGIYKIKNLRTGTVYIGQSKNIEKRFEQHKEKFKNGTHINKEMQKDYNRGDRFSYRILEESIASDRDTLDILEEKYIKKYDTKRKGYNRTWGGRTDKYASEQYRKKNLNSKIKHSTLTNNSLEKIEVKARRAKYYLNKSCPKCKKLLNYSTTVCPDCHYEFKKAMFDEIEKRNKEYEKKHPIKYSNDPDRKKHQLALAKKYGNLSKYKGVTIEDVPDLESIVKEKPKNKKTAKKSKSTEKSKKTKPDRKPKHYTTRERRLALAKKYGNLSKYKGVCIEDVPDLEDIKKADVLALKKKRSKRLELYEKYGKRRK